MTTPDLDAIQARAKRAHDHVCDIAQQKARWKMTIPANEETDSDLLLSNALTDVPLLVAEVERLRYQLGEARLLIEGHERIEERISHHIPEHYEAGYNSLEDWANDANAVVMAAHAWRKCGRGDEDADKVDAAVEKIFPTDEYV